jgi:PAS domain S-box-containing protein
MANGPEPLGAFVRAHVEEILARWEVDVRDSPLRAAWSHDALRNELAKVLDELATELDQALSEAPAAAVPETEDRAVAEHAVQRAGLGATITMLAQEILGLRDAIEQTWPDASAPEANRQLAALRDVFDRFLISSIERFSRLRTGLLDAVDTIVREHRPDAPLEDALKGILHALITSLGGRIAGIDTIAILLRDDDTLRVRAALGPEEAALGFSVPIGEGFAGRIAAERKPCLLRSASENPELLDPALRATDIRVLYGVPLIRAGDVIGVAHMGSLSAQDFSHEAKALFRAVMERATSVLHGDILREGIELERARYQALVENSPPITFVKHLDGRYASINGRSLADLGLRPEAFLGHTDYDVFPRDVADALRERDRRVLEAGRAIDTEDLIVHDTHRRVYLAVRFPIRDANGRIAMLGGIATDITDRQTRLRAQELLAEVGRVVASSLDQQVIATRLAETVVPQLADGALLELVDPSGARGLAVAHHRDPALARRARGIHLADAVLRAREPRCRREVSPDQLAELAADDASRATLRLLAPTSFLSIPLAAAGRELGTWVFLRDPGRPRYDDIDFALARTVGLRTSLALDNAQLYDASRRAIRARDEVLGIVAHDLRNPLDTIMLSADALDRRLPADADRERRGLAAIDRAANEMRTLISDLLDHYAIERGEIAVAVRRWPAGELLDAVVEDHHARIEAASLALDIERPPELPEVAIDHDRILQVFGNLVGNAVKFTPAGGRVTIGARRRDGEVEYFVRDTGIGLAPEQAAHLFDRYWRANRADRRGVGLGLSISKGIVDAHGGRIWADSEHGKGTTVAFTVPEAVPQPASAVAVLAP